MRQEGKLYIDSKDAFLRYGVFVEQFGYKQVVEMPAFKTVANTEWEEYDGAEYDLSAPVFDTRTFTIQFMITDIVLAGDFLALLSDKSYHIFEFKELDKKYKLRLVSNNTLSSNIRLGKIYLSFANDFAPVTAKKAAELSARLDEYNIILNQEPYDEAPAGFRQFGYKLDDIDFSRFGVYVVGKTDDNIQKAPNVRDNLTLKADTMPGVAYDNAEVRYKPKDVQLNLFIYAADITEFWTRWYALFTVLAQPEERTLFIEDILDEFKCFYKKNTVSKFEILRSGKVWCEFSVTLTFTDSRPLEVDELLASEIGELIILENEDDVFIDLKRYAD